MGVETDDCGLYYMRERYYNPIIQRFVNVDPIRDELNWYGYCNDNTITGIDPTGNITINEIIDKIKGVARTVYNGGKSVVQAIYNDA